MQSHPLRLADLINNAGYNISTLAEAAAIPRMTLTRRLANPASFTLQELDRIAKVLGVTPIDVIASTRAFAIAS